MSASPAYPLFTMSTNVPAFANGTESDLSLTWTEAGGASRDRTGDLKLAKLALSQLSYGPGPGGNASLFPATRVVGLGRFELPTSRLSSARSNQLSYRP